MKYSLLEDVVQAYLVDEKGRVQYYTDEEGNKIPLYSDEKITKYSQPKEFDANINNKLDDALIAEFGVDNSARYSQIVVSKGTLPFKEGTLIWKTSQPKFKYATGTFPLKESADFIVMGVATEGIHYDLFLLQRNIK